MKNAKLHDTYLHKYIHYYREAYNDFLFIYKVETSSVKIKHMFSQILEKYYHTDWGRKNAIMHISPWGRERNKMQKRKDERRDKLYVHLNIY